MSLERVKNYFETVGLGERVYELNESSATVAEAAMAVGCEPKEIAKTLSFLVNDQAVLVVAAGDAKVDNKKYKDFFQVKAKMIRPDQVENYVGYTPGGVCPFLIPEQVKIYLDVSMKRFDWVYPAAGSSNSAVRLSLEELEQHSHYVQWIDVCKGWE
ncbi:EbsC protein [Blautia sp. An249]|uniref:YbaK/EbsC family protein n=1 Tax=Blautia sp. An249 TaxID=1965603 RepID=UPI000B378B84|nr:YbaK/EbsC family protein [Blautia sp. An249]OUO78155.1 EbsC protein [Blautia sp. An249]